MNFYMSDTARFQNCLENALDLLATWVRSSAFPAPEIHRSLTFNEFGDQLIKIEVPALHLTSEELKIFGGKIDCSDLSGRALLIRGNLSAVAGRLGATSSREIGTVFEIFIPAVDPLKQFVQADQIHRKLLSLDFTLKEFFWMWRWVALNVRKIKKSNQCPSKSAPTITGNSSTDLKYVGF